MNKVNKLTSFMSIMITTCISISLFAQNYDSCHIVTLEDVGLHSANKIIEDINAPFNMPNIKRPFFPNHTINIFQTGAKHNKICTESIQRAIDKINKYGGGTVIIPNGIWMTGRITLKSNVNLHLENGAELQFSGEIQEYQPPVFTRNEGVEMMSLGAMIFANGAENIAITGNGIIKGPGKGCEIDTKENNDAILEKMIDANMPISKRIFDGKNGRRIFRPLAFGPINCKNILVEGIKFCNCIFWNLSPIYCENVIIRNVEVNSYGTPRGDGIDIVSCKNVLIEYTSLNTTDDGFTLKGGRNEDGMRVNIPSENIVIRYCHAKHSAGGIAIGSETAGTIRNVYVHHCVFENTINGSYIKSRRNRGGGGQNIFIENIKMINVKNAFYWDMLGSRQWSGELADRLPARKINELTPIFKDIHFKNILVDGCDYFINAKGLPENPINNITFNFVKAKCNNLINVADVQNVSFENCIIETDDKSSILTNCKNIKMKNVILK